MEFWRLSLAVETDDEDGLVTASVLIVGGLSFAEGSVRVTLVDLDQRTRASVGRPIRSEDIGTEVRLPAVSLPGGVSVDQALRWAWDVALEADGVERIRWRRYLEIGTTVGADGEIGLAGPADELRSKAEGDGWGPDSPWDPRDTDRFLSDLIASGIINEADRKGVLAEAHSSGRTVERILVDRGQLAEREMLQRFAAVSGSELVDLDDYPIDAEAAARIPEEIGRRYGLIVVGYRGDMFTVAMCDPQNGAALRAIQACGGQPYMVLASRTDVLRALDRFRHRLTTAQPVR